jgi:hypothetical protein
MAKKILQMQLNADFEMGRFSWILCNLKCPQKEEVEEQLRKAEAEGNKETET